jgi:hypothetical protein
MFEVVAARFPFSLFGSIFFLPSLLLLTLIPTLLLLRCALAHVV